MWDWRRNFEECGRGGAAANRAGHIIFALEMAQSEERIRKRQKPDNDGCAETENVLFTTIAMSGCTNAVSSTGRPLLVLAQQLFVAGANGTPPQAHRIRLRAR
jgi:hypothetical protein